MNFLNLAMGPNGSLCVSSEAPPKVVARFGPMPPTCRIHSCDQPPSTGSSAPVVKVASNARKRTALAISSDVPQRFIGTMPIIFSLSWAAASLSGNTLAQDRRVDGTGRHRVDANLARKQLGGERPSE